jgi:hypothetical protein
MPLVGFAPVVRPNGAVHNRTLQSPGEGRSAHTGASQWAAAPSPIRDASAPCWRRVVTGVQRVRHGAVNPASPKGKA